LFVIRRSWPNAVIYRVRIKGQLNIGISDASLNSVDYLLLKLIHSFVIIKYSIFTSSSFSGLYPSTIIQLRSSQTGLPFGPFPPFFPLMMVLSGEKYVTV